jgi:hypothetical protein
VSLDYLDPQVMMVCQDSAVYRDHLDQLEFRAKMAIKGMSVHQERKDLKALKEKRYNKVIKYK